LHLSIHLIQFLFETARKAAKTCGVVVEVNLRNHVVGFEVDELHVELKDISGTKVGIGKLDVEV